MINTNLLKRRMSEMRITQAELVEYLDIATPTMCQKINNIRPFSLEEANKVALKLRIKDKEFGEYFFAN